MTQGRGRNLHEEIEQAVNTAERLRTLYEYYVANRQVGHTTAMLRGATNTACAIILVGHYSQKRFIHPLGPHAMVMSWAGLQDAQLRGLRRPLLIDNHAMTNILHESLTTIERLTEEVEVLREFGDRYCTLKADEELRRRRAPKHIAEMPPEGSRF